ncbi:MAG: epoxide hydrolase [Planctomycetota bacterium]|nr:MAG: epoxide hydrolase [Planctomycetota bacterium]
MPASTATSTSTAAIRHSYVQANGIRFHLALAGEDRPAAPLVLMLHGFPECWYSWRHQLAALGAHALCAAPDLRGYGETDKPRRGYDLDTLAADAAALIRALGRERAVVVGHDWGGAIALHLAERHPEHIERLCLLNAVAADDLAAAIFRRPAQLRRSWYILSFALPLLPERRLSRQECAIVPRILLAGARRREAFTREDLEVFRRALARPGAVRAALAYYRTGMVQQLRRPWRLWRLVLRPAAAIRPLAVPGLVLWGRDDPFLGVELLDDLRARFAGPLTIRLLERCGHWTQQEAAAEVNRELQAFVQGR